MDANDPRALIQRANHYAYGVDDDRALAAEARTLLPALATALEAAEQRAERAEQDARAATMATENRLKLAQASVQMRGREIEELRARLAVCDPVVEAVREMQSCGCQADDCEHTTKVMSMPLPAKRTP